MIVRDILKMNEIISGELWFAIAKLDFDVWRILIKSVRVFWLYVQKNGGYKIVEKLFGNILLSDSHIEWNVGKIQYRFNGLPFLMRMPDGYILWYEGNSKGLTGFYGDGFRLSGRYFRALYYNGGFSRNDGYYIVSYEPPKRVCDLDASIYIDRILFANSYVRKRRFLYTICGLGNGCLEYFQSTEASDLPCILRYDGSFH